MCLKPKEASVLSFVETNLSFHYRSLSRFSYFPHRLLVSSSTFAYSVLPLLSSTRFSSSFQIVFLFLLLLSYTRFFFCCQIGAFVYRNGGLLLSIVADETKRRALAASCC
uniref:Transmembrane protein n=1 Tax=Pseudo-nitzschia australis TaxID=44445 RepID=A0A7S4AKR8_9STRA